MTRIITLASGKSGVGKTSIAVNLAAQLAERGQRVCLLDAGSGPDRASALLGIVSGGTLKDLARYGYGLDEVLVRNRHGIDVVPAGPDNEWLSGLAPEQVQQLADSLAQLDDYDFVLIDSTSTIAQNLLSFSLASPEIILIITPDSNSLRDAYALLKLLFGEQYAGRIHTLVNKSINQSVGTHSYNKFKEVASFYLEMQIPLLGLVSEDRAMQEARQAKRPLDTAAPASKAANDIGALADRLLTEREPAAALDIRHFCQLYLQATGINEPGEPEAPEIQSVLEQPLQRKEKLQDQLDYLSGQIDNLIEEIERLRAADGEGRRNVEPIPLATNTRAKTRDPCSELCLAAELAHDSEQVSVMGETFSIFHINKPNGELQWFACHSLDDDLEKPEHNTHSS